jgi:hypothetical protein
MRNFAERAVLLALGAGTGAAVLYVALNRLAPDQRPLTFGMAFLGWSLAFYATLLLAVLALCWGLARLLKRPWLSRAALALLGVGFLLGAAALNRVAILRAFRLKGPAHFTWLTPTALALSAAALLLCALLPLDRRWLPRVFGLLAPLAAALAFLPTPSRAGPPAKPRPASPRDMAHRLLVVGIDGADWGLMEPLLARGELPTIAALKERGAWGDLQSIWPTASPLLWTTVVTGQPASRHGVEDFTCLRMAGVNGVFRKTKLPRGIGFGWLYGLLERTKRIDRGPVMSSARMSPALWEIATAEGSPISVVSWWATWPAESVLGTISSERVHYYRQLARDVAPEEGNLTYPEDLYPEILPLVMTPDQVTYEHARPFMNVTPAEFEEIRNRPFKGKTIEGEFKYLYSMFETDRRIALHVIERTRRRFGVPADLLVLFRIIDIASHASLHQSELVKDHLDATPEDLRRYHGVVSEAYRSVDRALGQIVESFGEGNVLVISDHGFRLEIYPGSPTMYHHRRTPPGIFLAAGPAFRPGRVEGLSLYDIMPLMTCLKRFPVAEDLEGHVPEKVLDPTFLANAPVRRVATYGPRGAVVTARGGGVADEAQLERLRALGYIQ